MSPAPSAALREQIAANPGVVFEDAAREHGVPPRTIVEALPENMRRFAPGDAFVPAMQDVATWGDVTLIVHTDDGIMEFTGPVPKGEIGRGYFNLMSRTGFHGHLRHERCDGIAFIERTFMGRNSCLMIFLNKEGGVMFKVFVGRDEQGQLKADQLEKFRALREKLCTS